MTKSKAAQMSLEDDFDRPFEDVEPLQWGALRELCHANAEYFMSHQDENSVRIRAALLAILDHLIHLQPLYKEISRIAPLFDFDPETPGNGYRSFLILVDRGIIHARSVCHQIYCQKDSIFFRKSYHMREIEACSQLLASLCTCLEHLQTLYSWSGLANDERPSLFIVDDHSSHEMLNKMDTVNQYCFYGRCLGFQFCDSLKTILKLIMVGMATFSEAFYANGTLLARCTNSVKYMLDPELRARRIVDISQHADVSFCQAFWFLNETDISRVPMMASTSLAINQIISIPPEELIAPTLSGSTVSIPIPNSHIGKKPIHVRLLSSKRREGMVGSGGVGGELQGSSDELIIHCHGGGFVSQTSMSHETYLRTWAMNLDVPILSIDYSLAPEAPFPRALEEVLYAYVWALNHASTLLGSKALKVLLAGDSAGANLNLGVTLKCIQLNIRKPDGLFMAYTPVLVDFILSPSRLLSLTDPMLPMGFLLRCLKAYAATDSIKKNAREREQDAAECAKSDTESFAEVSESDLIALALSPNGDEANDAHKLASLPSDSTLNSVTLTEADGAEHLQEDAKSQDYVNKFVELYRNCSANSSNHIGNSTVATDKDTSKNGKPWSFFGWSLSGRHRESRELDTEHAKSHLEEYIFTVPRDPYLSPYLASDNLLAQLPPVKLLTSEMDPCLDDSIMFARKLRLLGILTSLDVLPGLPHGFLNFVQVSKEAADASDLCVKRIQELLALAI